MPSCIPSLSILNNFLKKPFICEIPHRKLVTMFFFVLADVQAGFKAIPSVTREAFKGSIQYIQKGYPTL